MRRPNLALLLLFAVLALGCGDSLTDPPGISAARGGASADNPGAVRNVVRFATFNASLNRFNAGDLISDLSTQANTQAQTVAEIIQQTRPDARLWS